ncbi:MAG: hypothetical protein P8N72_10240 [Flavimaricola sp.]|nr:hypothetical protein [Flavimaricola sp.]
MTIYDVLPWLAGAGVVAFAVTHMQMGRGVGAAGWLFPAGLSVAFLIWSLWSIISVGPFGFWIEHTRNAWGNQIWFDLLLGIGAAWYLLVPKAKALGMNLSAWLLLILCTGCIGLMAMIARLNYLALQDPEKGRRLLA